MKSKSLFPIILLPFLLSLLAFSFLQTSSNDQVRFEIDSIDKALIGDSVSDDDVVYVYITKTGKKYHRGSCRHLRKSKIKVSLDDAKERGYKPCKVCKPPK